MQQITCKYQHPLPQHLVVDLNMKSNERLKANLIIGHNGIRDRISRYMKIETMLRLVWDNDLADMAHVYLAHNKPFADDECTNYEQGYGAADQHGYFENGSNAHTFIAQNRYCMNSRFFPTNLIELAIRSWYYDKNHMMPPKQTDFSDMITLDSYELIGLTNFTHLAFGWTHRFGCAILG